MRTSAWEGREALRAYRRARLTDEIGFYEFQQMKFEEQWGRLKRLCQ